MSRPASAGNFIRAWQTRAVLCRVALSNLRSVTHHINPSAGAIFGCSSYMLHTFTWLPTHARGAQPGAFEVQTVVLLLLCGLKLSRLCSLPWQLCGSCSQERAAVLAHSFRKYKQLWGIMYHTASIVELHTYVSSSPGEAPHSQSCLACPPFAIFVGLPYPVY